MERISQKIILVGQHRIKIVNKNLKNCLPNCIVREILQYDKCPDLYNKGRVVNGLKTIIFTLPSNSTPTKFFNSDNCSVEYDTDYGTYQESPGMVIATLENQLQEDGNNIHTMLKAITGRGLWDE